MTDIALTIIPEVGLTEIEREPRVRDIDLAERLGISRPRDIRKLIERNKAELDRFGICATVAQNHSGGRGRPTKEYWLNEEQALLVSVLSNAENAPAVRAMLIRVFVAYRRGHLIESPSAVLDDKTKHAIGGIVKKCTAVVMREQLAAVLPTMLDSLVAAKLAEQNILLRHGKTAKQIWDAAGLPPRLRGATVWFGNRLKEMGCCIDGEGRFDRGSSAVRLFDPDKASLCLRNGLLHQSKVYASERMGQRRLRLVGGGAASFAP